MQIFFRCVAAAIVIAIAGCASSSPSPTVASAPEHISAPLNLCAPTNAPPKDVAAQAGYVQYAVTVINAVGKPVRDLKQSDFVAYAGTQWLPIKYFRENKGDTPQSIVIVIDESGSMVNKLVVRDPGMLQNVRQQIAEASRKLNKCDEVAAIAVGGHPVGDPDDRDAGIRVIQPLTTDHALAVSRIPQQIPYGRTPLYDGINRGLELIESAHYPNRAMILITDGFDNTSNTESGAVLDRAQKDIVPIYVIGIGDPKAAAGDVAISIGPFVMGGDPENQVDVKNVKALSAPSGGQYFVVSELAKDKSSTFVDAVGKVEDALGYGYSIGVIAPESAGRTVTIALTNPGEQCLSARSSVP
jgi:VWFA-related protein